MLVPQRRLLFWVALVVLPFSAIGTTVPGALPISSALIAGLVFLALLDAFRAPIALRSLRIELPDLLRLQKDRAGLLELRVHNESEQARTLRIGLAFPPEFAATGEEQTILLPAGAKLSRIEWPCTAGKRGQYFLERVYLETSSPLGFWAVRRQQPVRCELRVYPDLFRERKNVAALFLRRGDLGAHAQRQVGQGREFQKLRNYVAGDTVADIHWKASAKRGHPVTKVFQVERAQEVYVLIDASRLSARTLADGEGTPTTVLERFVTAALLLGLAAEQQGDQFGLLTFSDRVLSFVRAKSGRAHYDACRDRLYTLHPQIVTPDFDEVAAFIRLRLRKRALLIFLTALDDPMLAESFVKNVDLICRQHLIIVNMLQPAAARPIFTGEPAQAVDDLYHRLGGHWEWRALRELEKVLQRRGVRFRQLDPAQLSAQLVAQHSEIKARQLV